MFPSSLTIPSHTRTAEFLSRVTGSKTAQVAIGTRPYPKFDWSPAFQYIMSMATVDVHIMYTFSVDYRLSTKSMHGCYNRCLQSVRPLHIPKVQISPHLHPRSVCPGHVLEICVPCRALFTSNASDAPDSIDATSGVWSKCSFVRGLVLADYDCSVTNGLEKHEYTVQFSRLSCPQGIL